MVLTIFEIRNPFGIVGAGGTTSVADGSLSPAMLLPVTLALVLPSGICTVTSVLLVLATGTPLMYSVYESASAVASHANVTVRSASDGRLSVKSKIKVFMVLVLVQVVALALVRAVQHIQMRLRRTRYFHEQKESLQDVKSRCPIQILRPSSH